MAGMTKEGRDAFFAELARVNLQRLFWLLIIGIASRVVLLVVNHYSAVQSEVFAAMQWFDLIVIPPLIALTVWLRRPGASTRLAWMLILFVVWGTLGMGVIQALTTAGEIGYRAIYVLFSMICAVAYVLPPRLMLPAFAVVHAVYVTLVLTGDYDQGFRLASLSDGTLGVIFAAAVSWLLYRAKWNETIKERTIEAQTRELAARNAELNELMAVVAHDLRSPLSGLKRTLEFAQELDGSPRLRQTLGAGAKGCDHLLAITGRLLDTQALEDRCREMALRASDLRVACTAAIDRIEPVAVEKRVKLVMEDFTGGELALARMEATAMARVLDNLLANAVRHSPADGTVTVRLGGSGHGWRIDVSDEGPGVPKAEREEIFQKFRRGRGEKAGGGSVGLGLFIAAKLMAAMNGRVECRAGEKGGATFRLELVKETQAAISVAR
jgi:signal transduction histidine kinase